MHNASTNLQGAHGVAQDCTLHDLCDVSINPYLCPERLVSVPPASKYLDTDRSRPDEEGPPLESGGEVPSVRPGSLVENPSEGSIHGALKGQDSELHLNSPYF